MMRHPMMQRLRQMTATPGVPYQPFKDVPEAARPHLRKALEFEQGAGLAVIEGRPERAEHLRAQARASWRAAREMGL